MTKSEKLIIKHLTHNPNRSSKEIHEGIQELVGYATVKRILKRMCEENLAHKTGNGKSTKYALSLSYNLIHPIELDVYFHNEIDERVIFETFNLDLITEVLSKVELFKAEELDILNELQKTYTKNINALSEEQYLKELERLAIDLSWKSAQIEGNTYSLLETERLLKEKITAAGKKKDEAIMLLNHKDALDFILENTDYMNRVSIRKIEDIHSILIKELGVDRNIRTSRVGISGTNYKPLDNEYQIREALQQTCDLVNKKDSIFEKAFLLLILLSYIQAFNDGNKRTARIVSNACLINYNHCPISFRTVDSIEYKKAMLLFYEQNNVSAFKYIFISQFKFAVETYF